MGKPPNWAPWKHDVDDRGPAWAAKSKHAELQAKCPVCLAKKKDGRSSNRGDEEELGDMDRPMKPTRRITGKTTYLDTSAGSSAKQSSGSIETSASRGYVRS